MAKDKLEYDVEKEKAAREVKLKKVEVDINDLRRSKISIL